MSLTPFREKYPCLSKREIEKMAGDYLVKTVVSRLLYCAPETIEILREGKPVIKNGGLQFNLSHSEDYLVLGVGEFPLGVDIQKISSIREKTMEAYYTAAEKQLVKLYGEAAFYEIWTKKESYVKYTGEGIKGLRKLSSYPENIGFYTKTIHGYQISVCAEVKHLPKTVEIWTEAVFLE